MPFDVNFSLSGSIGSYNAKFKLNVYHATQRCLTMLRNAILN